MARNDPRKARVFVSVEPDDMERVETLRGRAQVPPPRSAVLRRAIRLGLPLMLAGSGALDMAIDLAPRPAA